jgi:signal transduction histidine kinase
VIVNVCAALVSMPPFALAAVVVQLHGCMDDARRAGRPRERRSQGPFVIKDRVRLLGGQLHIESQPGEGARLEIAVPLSRHAIHA